jgi:drug/metabolite transporter (DMT)-like permease
MGLPPDIRSAALGLLNAGLISSAIFCQKMHGVKGGSPLAVLKPWLIAAMVLYLPTFFIGNLAYRDGKIAPFLAASSTFYIWSTLVGRFFFGEPLGPRVALGLACMVGGIALILSGGAGRPG